MVGEAGLIIADPPLAYCMAHFGVMFLDSTIHIFTHHPICAIIHPTHLRVAMGAAPPIPPEGTFTKYEPHADFPVVFFIELVIFLDFLPFF